MTNQSVDIVKDGVTFMTTVTVEVMLSNGYSYDVNVVCVTVRGDTVRVPLMVTVTVKRYS